MAPLPPASPSRSLIVLLSWFLILEEMVAVVVPYTRGDGGVLREVARHPGVEDIVICELDQEVIDVSKKYLPTLAEGYNDPRVTVTVMDGNKFMSENQASFDVIITDSSDPVGPAAVLFETPFYKAMHAALRDGGIVCTQVCHRIFHSNSTVLFSSEAPVSHTCRCCRENVCGCIWI
jgi:spermidine synthase